MKTLNITRETMTDVIQLTEGVAYTGKVTMMDPYTNTLKAETAVITRQGTGLQAMTLEKGAVDLINFDTYNNGYHHMFERVTVVV